MLMYGLSERAAPWKANVTGYAADASGTVRIARMRLSGLAKRSRKAAARSRIARGLSPRGHTS